MSQYDGYATAIACQIPRQLEIVRRRIEDEGRLAGEEFYYGWGAGKDRIEGPSVKLANALARCWGNCALELLPVQETRDGVKHLVITNSAREIRARISPHLA